MPPRSSSTASNSRTASSRTAASSNSDSASRTGRISTSTALAVMPGACPHEIRPGTTVCLHCRQADRLAAGDRRRRAAARFSVALIGVAVCGAVVTSVTGGALKLPAIFQQVAKSLASPPSAPSSSTSSSTVAAAAPAYGATDAVPAAAAAVAPTRAPSVSPIVAEGRSVLRTGGPAVAVRAGDIVTVQFDLPDSRTRRADKFESIVRATLPEVYGAAADSALARVSAGTLATPEQLVTELPSRGVRLPLAVAVGGAITVWPETRPGRDGPLVVSYRASVTP